MGIDFNVIAVIASALSGYYLIHRDIKSDMKDRHIEHKRDMEKMDERWEKLFSLFVQDKIDSSAKK